MSADADFFKFNKKNDEQMFVNVKKSLTFNSLLKINSERLSEKAHDNNNDVFITAFTFD